VRDRGTAVDNQDDGQQLRRSHQALGPTHMPARWSISWGAVVAARDDTGDVEVSVPKTRSDNRVFVNDGINSFAVELDNPIPAAPKTDLVLYDGVR
jgi:hypothetical protein